MKINNKTMRIINLLSIIVIVIMLNLLASKCLFKIDLTANKLYTLSEGTKKIITTLPDIVYVKIVANSDRNIAMNTIRLQLHFDRTNQH